MDMKIYPDCTFINCEQRSPEWFTARKGLLTASQFGDWLTDFVPKMKMTIEEIKAELSQLGISFPPKGLKADYERLLPNPENYYQLSESYKSARLTSAAKCLAEFAGYPDPPPFETDDMRRGTEMEPIARNCFMELTGLAVEEVGFAKGNGWFGCSPDGIIPGSLSGLEIKCPRPSKLIQYCELGGLPDDYRAQVHGCMAVSGATSWHFFAFFPGFPSHHFLVERDEYTEQIKEGLTAYSEYFQGLADRMMNRQNAEPIHGEKDA